MGDGVEMKVGKEVRREELRDVGGTWEGEIQ